ncbi:ribonuclease T2 family protein [Sphingomonas profundi]|uniref:ribonuclease T2 family protein n=1 Tax=Alterirhizorhabdus profundi TaxID=2681549 RepID=UPI0012E815F9|nr:ribonuclease T [Sphingomonas profundi]
MRRMALILPAVLAALLPAAAHAQASACTIPASLPRPRPEPPTAANPRRIMPIGRYTLAISWSPGYCPGKAGSAEDAFQCGGANGRFGFTLHGLWPDAAGESWPQYCRATPLVPERVVREMLCTTPSVQLIQHEWAKHGTCMSPTPRAYFAQSSRLYRALRFPDMHALAARDDVTAGDIAAAFAASNRGIREDMVRVTTGRDGRLAELWLCLDTRLRYTGCPAVAGGVARTTRVRITDPG